MNRLLLALAVAVLLLGSLTRLGCSHGEEEPVAPDAPTEARAPAGPIDLLEPGHKEEGREAAAAAQSDAAEPEQPEASRDADLRLLLEGLVIDGRGIGVSGATVRLERHTVDTGGIGMRSVKIQPLPRLTTQTDAEGRFEIRGVEAGAVVVSAAKDGFVLREEVECVLPATRVTLVMERTGAILVTVAPVALDLAGMVYVEVRDPGGERVHNAVGAFRKGRLVCEELLPGPYDVVVAGRLSRRPLLTVTGVQVREGEITEDPRLQGLDLRAVLRRIRITVVDAYDQPMPGVTVWVHHGFGENGKKAGDDGSIELAAGVDGVDVAVRETGWRNVRHRAVTEDLVIRLERPLALRLLRPAGRSAELGDLYLYVKQVHPTGDPRASEGNSDWTLPAGEDAVEVGLDAAGVYHVQWAAVFGFAGRGTANFYPRGVAPQVVEIAEGEGTKEVALALDPNAVDELLARLGTLADELQQQPGETDEEHERRVLQVILRENRR